MAVAVAVAKSVAESEAEAEVEAMVDVHADAATMAQWQTHTRSKEDRCRHVTSLVFGCLVN